LAVETAVALIAPVLATVLRYVMSPWLGDNAPLIFHILAILIASLVGGLWGGLVSTIVGTILSWFVFLSAGAPGAGVRVIALLLNGLIISLIGQRIRVERRRADQTDRELRRALKHSDDAQQALAMQARVLESMAEGVCVLTESGAILFTNPAFDSIFGFPRGALLGTNIAELKDAPLAEAQRRYAAAIAEAQTRGTWTGEQRHRRSDGTPFETQTRITPIRTGGDWCYVCVQEDVTQRRRAQEALHSLNQDLRNRVQEMSTLLDVLPVGIGIAVDSSADNIRVNSALAKTLRLSIDANASLTAPAEERPKFRVLRDGVEVPANDLPLQKAARLGLETRDMELDVAFDDGSTVRLLEYAVPLLDDQGRPRGSIGAFVDISDRRAAEREREQLVSALTKHGRELSVLSSAAQELNKVLDAGAIVRTLVRAALQISEASSGAAVLLYNGAPSRPICQFADDNRQNSTCEAAEFGAADWVTKHRAPFLTNNAATDEVVTAAARARFQVANLVCLPIIGRDDELLGCFELHNKPGGFSTGDVVKLQTLSAGASIALENARLLAQIRDADRRKDDFLAMLAHELRNPLAPLRSAVDVMMMVGDGDDSARQLHEVMDRQISHMGRIIDDLLDVSRLTRGRIELRREKLDWTKLVADALTAHRQVFAAGEHTLHVDLPAAPIWVDGDATRLAQVFDNLLSNARKFTDAGGAISVRLGHSSDDLAVLEVSDSGIGVSPEDLGRIFDIFTQADRSLDRRRGGLGLGLALVKGLIELHGGHVSVESEGLGKGCTLRVALPVTEAPTVLASDDAALLNLRGSIRVLLVEDNRDAADTLRLLLETRGYTVLVAVTGREAIEMAPGFAPDAVVCDIGLPELDGFAVARTLRSDPRFNAVRLIALTGYGRDADVARARESGFDDHLTKPADSARLFRILSDVERSRSAASQTAPEA
jgi:PAS domain S-box-containing protein